MIHLITQHNLKLPTIPSHTQLQCLPRGGAKPTKGAPKWGEVLLIMQSLVTCKSLFVHANEQFLLHKHTAICSNVIAMVTNGGIMAPPPGTCWCFTLSLSPYHPSPSHYHSPCTSFPVNFLTYSHPIQMFPHWSDPPSCGRGCDHTSPITTTTTAYLHPTVVLRVELKEVIGLQNRIHEICEDHPLFTLTTLLHTWRCAVIGDGCVIWEEADIKCMVGK